MENEKTNNNPYRIAELRNDQTGELNADAIGRVFGFDKVDFVKLSQDNNGLYAKSFEDMLHAQGCEVLTRLAQAILRVNDPKREKKETEVLTEMHAFMAESVNGLSRLAFVRQGGAELILEEIYGGVHKDTFAAKRSEDGEIADWLGFDRLELASIARTTGLAVFEAIASARQESGMKLDQLKDFYQLAEGAPNHGPLADRVIATMCGSGALLELFDINFFLARKGLRETETSNFGKETVYRRPAAN